MEIVALFLKVLKFLGIIVVSLFLLLMIFSIISIWRERKVIRDRYEWLDVLSHYEWKRTLQIRDEMSKLKGKKVEGIVMYIDLSRLEEERLVEGRVKKMRMHGYLLTSREYKLTPSGTRRKVKGRQGEDQKIPRSLQQV